MSVNQLLCNFPTNSNFQVPTSNQGPVTFSVGGPPGGGAPPFTITQLLWAAPWGSDTTGDGSEDNPFLTILHAQTVITDASPTKFYDIMLYPGTYVENVAEKAFVNIVGFIPSNLTQAFYPARVTGTWTLGPSFTSLALVQAAVTNIDVDGDGTFAYPATSSAAVSFTNCQLESPVTLTQL